MQRTRIGAMLVAVGLAFSACGSDAGMTVDEPRAGVGGMALVPAASPTRAPLLGPEAFSCRPGTGDQGYWRYGVGRMRRGGLEPEELERDHIVIEGQGVNFYGTGRVVDGGTIEMEMDEDYFEPTVLWGPPGATVTIELWNEGVRPHNFSVPSQDIDINCGVRARGEVEVVFPRSGVLMFTCEYTATSGMRGAFTVEG